MTVLDVTSVPQPGPWVRNGRCWARADLLPLFFPQRPEDAKHAKALCHPCAVRSECLAYALDHPALQGVWGGLSERERWRLADRRAS